MAGAKIEAVRPVPRDRRKDTFEAFLVQRKVRGETFQALYSTIFQSARRRENKGVAA
jgi:hypothetical protein